MKKILIVEDEPDVLSVLAARLEGAGFEILAAEDSYRGMEKIRKELPDLIILDLMLPAGGGVNLLRKIRVLEKTRDLPVIILTGLRDQKIKNEITDIGVQGYFLKPYEPEELIGSIRALLLQVE